MSQPLPPLSPEPPAAPPEPQGAPSEWSYTPPEQQPIPTAPPAPAGPPAPPPGWAPPPLPTSFFAAQPAPAPDPVPQPWAPPGPTPPQRPSRRWVGVVAVIVLVGLVAASVLLWTRGVFPSASQPTAQPSGNPLPSSPVALEGGDLGRSVDLSTADGRATVTATRAEWSSTGEQAPDPGTAYLVVDLEFTGVSGAVPVGPVMTVAETSDKQRHPVAYGPTMPDPVPGALLHTGEQAKGSVGYMLPPGAVTLVFLDAAGEPMGQAAIPAP